MYRKIIFIAINLLSISPFTKVTILLFIAGYSFLTSYFCEPFTYKELNKIENYSLLSAMATLFAGGLYICDIADFLKAISFAFIIMVNIAFSLSWFWSVLNAVFSSYLSKFQQHFPNFTYFIVAGISTIEITKITFNICYYIREFKKNFSNIRKDLIRTYETDEKILIDKKRNNTFKKSSFKENSKFKQLFSKEFKEYIN